MAIAEPAAEYTGLTFQAMDRIDRSMRRLPGMGWFDLMTRRWEEALARA